MPNDRASHDGGTRGSVRPVSEGGPAGIGVHRSGIAAASAYVPRILVEYLARDPARDLPWWQWVDGTLVMADVSGFTALSERLAQAGKEGAEWLTDLINRFFGRMLDISSECGGTTLTFGGDAILLLFYGDDHERRGIAAALRMLHGTQELGAHRVGGHRVKLSMSMGAHAGRFLMAAAGSEASAQFLVLGPETVMTAKAEAAASAGELAITPELARRVGSHVEAEPFDHLCLVKRLVDTPRYHYRPEEPASQLNARTLAPFLPPFAGDVLRADPSTPMPELGSEHRDVSVVFVNVLGVDDILQADGPDVLAAELQRYLAPAVRLVHANHGYLVSNDIYTNGFKLIVAFGAPVAHERNAENALRFSASLREEIDRIESRFQHRIGVNGGSVFAGDVGPPYRRQYTVMGDAVNLSARLMSAAEPGQVIVSAATADAAGNCFLTQDLPPVMVKGKQRPIEIRAVLGQCEPPQAEPCSDTGFFGRERELGVLARAAREVEGGHARTVLIRGEAGMGKSRLAAEFERELPDRGWRVTVCRSYEHTQGQPFGPWVPALQACTGIDADDDTEARSTKVLEALSRTEQDLSEWASLLNPLLRLSISPSAQAQALDAGDRRRQLLFLVGELVRQAAAESPLLLHFEDLHWADASSIELIGHVARSVASRSVLLLGTERGEHAADLGLSETAVDVIDLGELPGDAAIAVVQDTLGTSLPRQAADVLVQKTRGNPLFLQEVARSINRSGAARGVIDERDLARRMAEVEVPTQIQGLLMATIDALSVQEKDTLRRAAVIGTTFDERTLLGAFDGNDEALGRCLDALVTQALLLTRASAGGGRAYDFRHALIQEVAYGSLPFATRRRLHHAVAEYLVQAHEAALDTVYESLVHHYSLSEDRPKTVVFAVKAGAKARSLLAHEEAAEYYRTAAESVQARTASAACARCYLLEQIGDCYDQVGKHAHAAIEYRSSLARARTCAPCEEAAAQSLLGLDEPLPVRAREAVLCYKTGVSYTRTHRDYRRSLFWLQRAARALPRGEALLGARIEQKRGQALLWIGAREEANECARHALAVARRHDDPGLQALAATTIAGAFMDTGDIRMSIRYDSLALDAYEKVSDIRGQAEAHANLAADYTCHGDFSSALEHSRQALTVYERTGDLTAAAITHCNVAEILVTLGRYDDAIAQLETALRLCERVGGGCTTVSGFAQLNFARALERSGRLDEAEERLRLADSLLKTAGASTFLTETAVELASVLFARGDVARARVECLGALEQARASGMRLVEARALRLLGVLSGRDGDIREAERCLRESAELARRADAPYEQALAYLELAALCAASGASFRRLRSRAIALLEPTGAAPDLERARLLTG